MIDSKTVVKLSSSQMHIRETECDLLLMLASNKWANFFYWLTYKKQVYLGFKFRFTAKKVITSNMGNMMLEAVKEVIQMWNWFNLFLANNFFLLCSCNVMLILQSAKVIAF